GNDEGQRFDYAFNPFIRRQQSEREQYGLAFRPRGILVVIRITKWKVGYAMRDEVDFFLWHAEYFLQQPRGMFAHDDETVRESSDFVHHDSLAGVGLAKNRVQSRHNGHLQAAQQPQDVATGR